MGLTEFLAELPAFTVAERQIFAHRALTLDEAGLSAADEALIERSQAKHRANPGSTVSSEEMKKRVLSRSWVPKNLYEGGGIH